MHGIAARVHRASAALLSANWREGIGRNGASYGYTCPDGEKYPYQWFWDSLLHALAWAEVDPAKAATEVRSLVAAQQPGGLIGHTIFWDAPVRLSRATFYNVRRRDDFTTATIQPPFLGWVWAEIADRLGDPGFREEGRDPITRYHQWIERERVDDTGLVWVILPDETGCDASPVFDALLGWRRHGGPGFAALVHQARRNDFSLARTRASGDFATACPLVNTAWALGHVGLARLGDPGARDRAREITAAMVDHQWDDRAGIFRLLGPDRRPLAGACWQGIAPVALPDLPIEIRERLIDEWILRPDRFWPAHPLPSVSLDDPACMRGDGGRIPQYWRGPSWPFTPPFVVPGLLRADRRPEAVELVTRIEGRLDAQGFREYSDPIDGTGMGAEAFSCQAVVLALRAWLDRPPIPAVD
ncbi:MAG: hypothetical protein EXQ74_07370 [Thermoleophilia bacterium]|nr:hypothetical protein [Thermoleophilia bacterium]